ncbi:RNA-directed DNA polymerase [Rhizobium leguminosarum]|uniref:RNA-directed DNA polymerase n=1 Tax=Rhizobium leguminosarum TaxID=384 RepID=A0AAJ1ECV1_RHILE|nr:reverse transcriptase family protein [Rhizobium leguminosarum]MBY5628553.1 RNA-directed DNA polymerase [Rhizobium leguminosarum]
MNYVNLKVSPPIMPISVEDWRAFFSLSVKRDSKLVEGYIRFIELCENKGLPPIFEERHLAHLIGIPYSNMAYFFSVASGRYRTFTIPKRRGGRREINVPTPLLLAIQQWILHNILYKLPMSEFAHGGVPGRSILSNARAHLGAKAVLRVDLKQFFDSVEFPIGIPIFEAAGYSPKMSKSLALLCFENGRLPQGAATSSTLANLAAISLDIRLSKLANKFELTYTRYVDDLTFSGRSIGPGFISAVEGVVEQCRFVVNAEKTQLARGKSPKFVTGLAVGGDRLRIPRAFRREVRNQAFQITRRGVQNHLEAIESSDPLIIEKVLGQLAFWLQVEPESAMARKLFANLSLYRRTVSTDTLLPPPRRIIQIGTMPIDERRKE